MMWQEEWPVLAPGLNTGQIDDRGRQIVSGDKLRWNHGSRVSEGIVTYSNKFAGFVVRWENLTPAETPLHLITGCFTVDTPQDFREVIFTWEDFISNRRPTESETVNVA